MAKSLSRSVPPRRTLPRLAAVRPDQRIPSVTLSLTKLAFTYASNIVRWVWKCPRHSGTMLSAVAVFAPGHLQYDRETVARAPRSVPLIYRLSPTAPLFSMADGQSRTDEVPIVVLRGRNLRLERERERERTASKKKNCPAVLINAKDAEKRQFFEA